VGLRYHGVMSGYLRMDFTDTGPTTVAMDMPSGTHVWIDHGRDATVVQVGKVQMTVSRTTVRLVSREGPATGHANVHEVEMWKGAVPS
jgi:hypothetical protein